MIINVEQFSTLGLKETSGPLKLVVNHEFLKVYGIAYYLYGWGKLQETFPHTLIELWLDCEDDLTLALQAVYAKVTGIIACGEGPGYTKLCQFAEQQGIQLAKTKAGITHD